MDYQNPRCLHRGSAAVRRRESRRKSAAVALLRRRSSCPPSRQLAAVPLRSFPRVLRDI